MKETENTLIQVLDGNDRTQSSQIAILGPGLHLREKLSSEYPRSDDVVSPGMDSITSNGRNATRRTSKQMRVKRLEAQSHIVFDLPGEYDHTTDLIYKFSAYNRPQRALASK